MSTYRISSEPEAEAADRRVIAAGLRAYNEVYTGPLNHRPVCLFLRSSEGEILGGLTGYRVWGWLHVDLLWVSEDLRGQGYGSRLLEEAEEEAIRDGCTHAFLDTFDFQALPFYERQGYQRFGVLEGFPLPGHRQFHLRKDLAERPSCPAA